MPAWFNFVDGKKESNVAEQPFLGGPKLIRYKFITWKRYVPIFGSTEEVYSGPNGHRIDAKG